MTTTPRTITPAEVLEERRTGPGFDDIRRTGGGHDGSGFFGFMPSCFCINCRNYYDPTGEQTAAYLNCEPSYFGHGAYQPSFFGSDLWKISYFLNRKDGIYWNSGKPVDMISLEELAASLDTSPAAPSSIPPRSILIIKGVDSADDPLCYHEWTYHQIENGYKYTLYRNGDNVYNADWRKNVILREALFDAVNTVAIQ